MIHKHTCLRSKKDRVGISLELPIGVESDFEVLATPHHQTFYAYVISAVLLVVFLDAEQDLAYLYQKSYQNIYQSEFSHSCLDNNERQRATFLEIFGEKQRCCWTCLSVLHLYPFMATRCHHLSKAS